MKPEQMPSRQTLEEVPAKRYGQAPEITRRECLPRNGVILGRSDAWTCPGNGGGQEPDGWDALGEVF